jgi:hypothetical protein
MFFSKVIVYEKGVNKKLSSNPTGNKTEYLTPTS